MSGFGGLGGMRGTSSAGRPIGTASRPIGTPGAQAGYGIALQQEVNVDHRPVTQQGMMGMRSSHGGGGGGRQVQDVSYFIGIIRQKVTELTNEIRKLRADHEQLQKDNASAGSMERRYETLLKEVRTLEGTLADYNLSMDKSRSGTSPEEVLQYQQQLHHKNEQEAQSIDRIFCDRRTAMDQIADVENQIQAVHQAAQDKINALSPERLDLYHQLMQRGKDVQAQLDARQQEVDTLDNRIREHETALRENSFREEYAEQEKRARRLQKEKAVLEEDLTTARMDPRDAQKMMMAKVKKDNKRTTELSEEAERIEGEIDRLRTRAADLTADMSERKDGGAGDSQKYEKLKQRDEEMSRFINSFDETRSGVLADQRQTQETIVGLLEHISRGLEAEGNMPSQERLKEMKDEVSFKERQLEGSQMTKARLEQERLKRVQEMEKINTLDDKISVELGSLTDKIATMKNDMIEFDNLDGLRTRAAETQDQLTGLRDNYIQRKTTIQQQVQVLSTRYEQCKKQLSANETAKTLESLEQKLRHYEQNIFTLKEYIETKGRETDFQSIKDEVMKMADDLNDRCISTTQTMDMRASAEASAGIMMAGGAAGGFGGGGYP